MKVKLEVRDLSPEKLFELDGSVSNSIVTNPLIAKPLPAPADMATDHATAVQARTAAVADPGAGSSG